MASRAIPSHLKPAAASGNGDADFAQRHHGKTQSHVVSRVSAIPSLAQAWHSSHFPPRSPAEQLWEKREAVPVASSSTLSDAASLFGGGAAVTTRVGKEHSCFEPTWWQQFHESLVTLPLQRLRVRRATQPEPHRVLRLLHPATCSNGTSKGSLTATPSWSTGVLPNGGIPWANASITSAPLVLPPWFRQI